MSATMRDVLKACLAVMAGAFMLSTAVAQEKTMDFDIPSQPLVHALDTFARQADIQLLYNEESLGERRTAGLKGTYTIRDGLDRLLRGTGVGYAVAGGSSIVIKPEASPEPGNMEANEAPPPGSSVQENLPTLVVSDMVGELLPNKVVLSTSPDALPSSVHVLGSTDIESMAVVRHTDILRKTPGVATISTGEGDVSDGVYMRGFLSQHGNSVAILVDGVPLNVSHSVMAPGATDFAWLLPEMIQRVEVVKGPFSALYGNHALGGAINIITKSSDASSVALRAGSYGTYQGIGVFSTELSNGVTPFLVWEGYTKDGYREHTEYDRYNAFNKISMPWAGGSVSLLAHAARMDYNTSGIPFNDDIRTGVIGRRDAMPNTDTDGGIHEIYGLVLNYRGSGEAGLKGSLFAGSDENEIYNASFFFPQTAFINDRSYGGFRLEHSSIWLNDRLLATVGTEGFYESGDYLSAESVARTLTSEVFNHHDVTQTSLGVFAQAQALVTRQLKLVGGLRYDSYRIDVENRLLPETSGKGTPDILSPKVGVIYSPARWMSIFANAATGFRMPTAGELSPGVPGAEIPFNGALEASKIRSADVGISIRTADRLFVELAVYRTTTEDEFRPNDSGIFENVGETERNGVEIGWSYDLSHDLTAYGSFTQVETEIKDPLVPGDRFVRGIPRDQQTFGAKRRWSLPETRTLIFDFYFQRLGESYQSAAGTFLFPGFSQYGLKATLQQRRVTGFAQLMYRPDESSGEFMTTRTPGGNYRFAPMPKIEALAGIKYTFQ